jgi:hypothetical protein
MVATEQAFYRMHSTALFPLSSFSRSFSSARAFFSLYCYAEWTLRSRLPTECIRLLCCFSFLSPFLCHSLLLTHCSPKTASPSLPSEWTLLRSRLSTECIRVHCSLPLHFSFILRVRRFCFQLNGGLGTGLWGLGMLDKCIGSIAISRRICLLRPISFSHVIPSLLLGHPLQLRLLPMLFHALLRSVLPFCLDLVLHQALPLLFPPASPVYPHLPLRSNPVLRHALPLLYAQLA